MEAAAGEDGKGTEEYTEIPSIKGDGGLTPYFERKKKKFAY